MMRKFRTLLAAAFLVAALFSNANAFTTESDGILSLGHPPSAVCWYYFGGMWMAFPC
jgi:hypothetical protein